MVQDRAGDIEHKWTAEQAKTNSAPFQFFYTHEVNHANKVEHRDKGEAYTWIPGDEKYFNILSKGHGIVLANKSNRETIKREYVSYVYNPDWWTITPNEHTSCVEWVPFVLEPAPKAITGSTPLRDPLPPSNDKIRKKGGGVPESSVDWKRITPTVTAKQTDSGESRPTSATPTLPDRMDLDELGNDRVKAIQFPSLLGEQDRNLASRMLEDLDFFEQFLKLAEQNGHLVQFKTPAKDDEEEGEVKSPTGPVSPQPKTNSNRLTSQTNLGNQAENSLKELTSSLLSKSKTEIKFKELNMREISSWGDAVEAYERVHSDWDRNQIERSLRRRINSRWTLEAYQSILPESLQGELHRVSDNSWMDPKVVSTIDLVRFLKRTCGVGQGTTNLHAGYEELLDLVKN